MESGRFITHPENAQQASAFTAPASLSFPGGAGEITPPSSEKDGQHAQTNGSNGYGNQQGGNASQASGVTPATPAATPGAAATQGVSGIVPTLQ